MNRIAKSWLIIAMISLTCFLSCSKIDLPHHERDNLPNDVIIQWSIVALNAEGGTTYANPLLVSRVDAMMHIAMHDALNAINHRYKQYAYKTEGKKFADPFAAAASAAYTVLLASFPENKSMLDSALSASLSTIANGMLKETGINLGMEAGNAILMLRAGDPVTTNPVVLIPVSTVPGVYNVVPPFDFLFAPFWQTVTPFSLLRPDQFRSAPHPALNSDRYAKDFNEIKEIGKLNSTTRTADQSAYAKWWFEFVELGWNRVARITATTHDMKLFATARMFALMNMAMSTPILPDGTQKTITTFGDLTPPFVRQQQTVMTQQTRIQIGNRLSPHRRYRIILQHTVLVQMLLQLC